MPVLLRITHWSKSPRAKSGLPVSPPGLFPPWFTSGDARVCRFIYRLKPREKLSTQSSVKFTTGKHIILVDWCHNLMGDFFPTFVAKLQAEKVLQNSPKKRWKKILILQNKLLRKTRSSYLLSTIHELAYLRLPHFGRFMDELFKPCERQKLLPIETTRLFTSDDPGSCFALACVKARENIWCRRTT